MRTAWRTLESFQTRVPRAGGAVRAHGTFVWTCMHAFEISRQVHAVRASASGSQTPPARGA
eukprot:scaffold29437_cov28-Tisochrysis_lutea.AAC.1